MGSEINKHIAIFINSSDKTSDIAKHFIASFKKYWMNCPFQVYIGVNKNTNLGIELSAIQLIADVSGWKNETIAQIKIIKEINPNIKHIIIFLDDFIINKEIDNDKILNIIRISINNNFKYIRFRTLDECFAVKFINKIKCIINNKTYFKIRKDHPYYSSLQVVLWDIDYYLKLVNESSNIWNFESINHTNVDHYSTSQSIISYKHIVEKGQWDLNADDWCKKSIGFFNIGNRETRSLTFIDIFFINLKSFSFNLFGYLPLRLKKLIENM
jgi:hypothetical protein